MREFHLLQRIYQRSQSLPPPVVVGPGDDAALLALDRSDLLVTVDQLIEGRHYDASSTPIDLIARKAIARSISDIAAMGGAPTCAFATGALRDDFEHADELFDSMSVWASHWRAPLAGGDLATTTGPTILTVTVLGHPHPSRGAILRSTAKPGDGVYVTGAVGGSFASGRHLTFEPRIIEARYLCNALGAQLHAMIDISDGLGVDATHIATASGVRIEIETAAIPCAQKTPNWRTAAGDGEDYELLFAAAGDVPTTCPDTGAPITRIGVVCQGAGCLFVDPHGQSHSASSLGWEHGAN